MRFKIAALALILLFGSCRTTTWGLPRLNFGGGSGSPEDDKIDGRDRAAILPVLRSRVEVEIPHFELDKGQSNYVEFNIASVDGGFRQAAGTATGIGGQQLNGDVDIDFRMRETNVVLGLHSKSSEWLSGDIFVGVAYHYLHLRGTSTNGEVGSTSRDDYGILVGIAGEIQAAEWARVYARLEFAALRASTRSVHWETGVALRVAEHADVLLGYRTWELDHRHGRNDLELAAEGLMLGMEFRF